MSPDARSTSPAIGSASPDVESMIPDTGSTSPATGFASPNAESMSPDARSVGSVSLNVPKDASPPETR
jgi:hypothetical protein